MPPCKSEHSDLRLYTGGWSKSNSQLDVLKNDNALSKMEDELFHLRNSAGYGLTSMIYHEMPLFLFKAYKAISCKVFGKGTRRYKIMLHKI